MSDTLYIPTANDPDIATCDSEPLAFCGQIQNEGALLVTDGGGRLTHYSDNLDDFFDLPDSGHPASLQALFADNSDYFRHRRQNIFEGAHYLIPGVISNRGVEGDLLSSEHAGRVLYEFEPAAAAPQADDGDCSVTVNAQALPGGARIDDLLRQIRALTGYDKIMIYRFFEDGSGEVVAELSNGRLDDYQGLRFPASDVPRNARALYVENPFRIIFDTESRDVPIAALPGRGSVDLDLSTSCLRSVSPLHIEYLGNMGVRSSCSFSIRVMGYLWGLVALHAVAPTRIPVRNRVDVRRLVDRVLAGPIMNERINADHQRFNAAADLVDRTAQRLAALLAGREEAPPTASLRSLVDSDDLLCLHGDRLLLDTAGLPADERAALLDVCRQQSLQGQFATSSLSRFLDQAESFRQRVSGVLYQSCGAGASLQALEILWLRREKSMSVDWAGKPEKLRREVDGAVRLSPRKSFERWTQEALGHATPWQNGDRLVATKIAAKSLSLLAAGSRRA
jgi:chemotaxis family two-component system sensor kinase Cph1